MTTPRLNVGQQFVVFVGALMTLASAGFSIWSTYIMITRAGPTIWVLIWVLWCGFWTVKWASYPLQVLNDANASPGRPHTQKDAPGSQGSQA